MKKISLAFLVGSALIFSPTLAAAKDDALAPVNCFDYYHFGSVQAHLSASVKGTVSGTPITFSGTLENSNPYPVVDGSLYVKIFRVRDGGEKNQNGPDVVDQFMVKDGIVLPANGSAPITFSWDIPSFTRTGDYQVATFFTTSKKFNLLGLSFTDDVVGNTENFHVSGEQKGVVAFDKAGEKVNGTAYAFASFPPQVSQDGPVTVDGTIRNSTDKNEPVIVDWDVYSWDMQSPENLVQKEEKVINVPSGGKANAEVTIKDARFPVYLAVGTLHWRNTTSIINVRFVRTGVDKVRINFPSVMSFPLKSGQPTTLFSCFHNSNNGDVQNGKLELSLTDMRGRVIQQGTWTGTITSAMMGAAETFTPSRNYSAFKLDAKLYQSGALIDSAHLVYDCKEIDPTQCPPPGFFDLSAFDDLPLGLRALLGAGFAIVVYLVFYGLWKWASRRDTTPRIG